MKNCAPQKALPFLPPHTHPPTQCLDNTQGSRNQHKQSVVQSSIHSYTNHSMQNTIKNTRNNKAISARNNTITLTTI